MSLHGFSDIKAILKDVDFFRGLNDESLIALGRATRKRHYLPGRMIFRQGDPGASMYIVVKGHVKIFLTPDFTEPLTLRELNYGDYFGELALFDDQPRSAHAQALDDVELLEISQETLSDYLIHHPQAVMSILRTMTERMRTTEGVLLERVAKNVDEELDKQLTWQDRLADKVAELNGSWFFILLLLGLSGGWMLFNTIHIIPLFDPYPFVFFNLLLAILVSLQGPLIVMSQNRKALLDRARAEADYRVNLKNEVNIERLISELQQFREDFEISENTKAQ